MQTLETAKNSAIATAVCIRIYHHVCLPRRLFSIEAGKNDIAISTPPASAIFVRFSDENLVGLPIDWTVVLY